MKRILVAGATGYLGSYVAQEFKSQGHFVRVLARSPEKLKSLDVKPDEIIQGEITRPARISSMPIWLVKAGTAMLKIFNRHQGELVAFFTTMMTNDMVAPTTGTRSLEDYFGELVERP